MAKGRKVQGGRILSQGTVCIYIYIYIYKITNVSYAEAARQIGGTFRQNDGVNGVSTGISGTTVGNVAYIGPDTDTRPV